MHLSRTGEFTLLLTATLTIMVGAALAPGLQSIAAALGVAEYAPLLITLPALGALLFAPLFGHCIDRLGARRTLLVSLCGYCLVGVGGILLHGPLPLAVNRILLGGFAAGVMAAGTAEIAHWYSGRARLAIIAKQGMAIELGGVIFLFIGGLLSELSWRGPFALYLLGLICALLTLRFIPARQPRLPGNEPHSQQTSASMRPIMITTFLAMALFFSMIVTLPSLLAGLGFSESRIGYLLSFISLVAVAAAMVMPKIAERVSERGSLILAFVSYALALLLFAGSSLTPLLVLAAVFAGLGFGLSIPLLNHATVESSNDNNRGRNLSLFAMAVFGGQFATSILEFQPLPQDATLQACALVAAICALTLLLARQDEQL